MNTTRLFAKRYQTLRRIGEGGMAFVYLATDNTLNREVAIKVMHEHMQTRPELRHRFRQEARSVSKLKHSNILEIYDFSGDDSEQLWIVTEYIEGYDLSKFTKKYKDKKLNPFIALAMVREVAKALAAAHQQGIIHRDIKTSNVMISKNGHIKLMDFGIAKDIGLTDFTNIGTFMGSPSYMSPEQIRGERVDARSDLYGLAVLFYELVTGELPFTGKTTHEIISKVLQRSPLHPKEIDQGIPVFISEFIIKGLEKLPQNRHQSAESIVSLLDNYLRQYGLGDSRAELEKLFSKPKVYQKKLEKLGLTKTILEKKQLSSLKKTIASGQLFSISAYSDLMKKIDRNDSDKIESQKSTKKKKNHPSLDLKTRHIDSSNIHSSGMFDLKGSPVIDAPSRDENLSRMNLKPKNSQDGMDGRNQVSATPSNSVSKNGFVKKGVKSDKGSQNGKSAPKRPSNAGDRSRNQHQTKKKRAAVNGPKKFVTTRQKIEVRPAGYGQNGVTNFLTYGSAFLLIGALIAIIVFSNQFILEKKHATAFDRKVSNIVENISKIFTSRNNISENKSQTTSPSSNNLASSSQMKSVSEKSEPIESEKTLPDGRSQSNSESFGSAKSKKVEAVPFKKLSASKSQPTSSQTPPTTVVSPVVNRPEEDAVIEKNERNTERNTERSTKRNTERNTNRTNDKRKTTAVSNLINVFTLIKPASAKVYLNDSLLGLASNSVNKSALRLKRGTYTLTVKKDGYTTVSKKFSVGGARNYNIGPIVLSSVEKYSVNVETSKGIRIEILNQKGNTLKRLSTKTNTTSIKLDKGTYTLRAYRGEKVLERQFNLPSIYGDLSINVDFEDLN